MVPSVYDCCKVQHTMYLHEKTIFLSFAGGAGASNTQRSLAIG